MEFQSNIPKHNSIQRTFRLIHRFSLALLQDIARDVRETKVHYSPSEKDGVFVVEVARGADSKTTPIISNITDAAKTEKKAISPTIVEYIDYSSSHEGNVSCQRSNEKVLVHPRPNNLCLEGEDVLMIGEDGAVSMSSPKHNGLDEACADVSTGKINTGLSQSDLSISSSEGSNRAYCYGAQEAYTVVAKGYQSPRITALIDVTAPEPIKIIDDNISPETDGNDTLKVQAKDTGNQTPTIEIGNILPSSVNTHTQVETDNSNGNDPNPELKQNGFKLESSITTNSQINGNFENGINGNDHSAEDLNDIMNLPAPPTCDEIKQLSGISGTIDNGNMDSLPPPPPELLPFPGPINVES